MYGKKTLHEQSHGESFLSFLQDEAREGVYLMDEPEAALSPQRHGPYMVEWRPGSVRLK